MSTVAVIYGGYNEPVEMKQGEDIVPGDIVLYSDEGWIEAIDEDRFLFSIEDDSYLGVNMQDLGVANGYSELLSNPRVNDDVTKQGGKLNIVKFAGDGFEVKNFTMVDDSNTLSRGDKLVLDGGVLVAFVFDTHCANEGDSALLLGEVTEGNTVAGDPISFRTDGYPIVFTTATEA